MLIQEKVVLAQLSYEPYVDEEGLVNTELEGKIAVYAIFDESQQIQYIGYSRNLYKSLLQHLVKQNDRCYWYKYYLIDRPNRSVLEQIKSDWEGENPDFNKSDEELKLWTDAIDIHQQMTDSQKEEFQKADGLGQTKLLKQFAREIQAQIKQKLSDRGVKVNFKFNSKLREQGLVDLK